MHTITKNCRINVIGGGISGLAIAIALQIKGFQHVKIFEKGPTFDKRRQGYGLTIFQFFNEKSVTRVRSA